MCKTRLGASISDFEVACTIRGLIATTPPAATRQSTAAICDASRSIASSVRKAPSLERSDCAGTFRRRDMAFVVARQGSAQHSEVVPSPVDPVQSVSGLRTCRARKRVPQIGWKHDYSSARTDVTMLLGLIFLLLVGAGAWSLDAWLAERRRATHSWADGMTGIPTLPKEH
jgi:hypothetical protein